MAKRVQVILEDDLDGSVASETVAFAIDGVTYEIDLSDVHVEQLRSELQPWIAAGRRVGGRRNTKKVKAGGDNGVIRTWALEKGLPVSPRGRISREIRDAYQAAH
ncbi:Lsr2 family protein [Luteococcus sp.]|uniref:histone-like nucleoid-structuring protein Lsr2 n=1 Tax=Luteococcus sp. TaxID=1969402 RepID=UPI003736B619